jgi:hypothetical protein
MVGHAHKCEPSLSCNRTPVFRYWISKHHNTDRLELSVARDVFLVSHYTKRTSIDTKTSYYQILVTKQTHLHRPQIERGKKILVTKQTHLHRH